MADQTTIPQQSSNPTPDGAAPSTGGNAGGPGPTATPPQQPATPTPTPPTPTPPTTPPPAPAPPSTLPTTQAELDAVVEARIARDRDKRMADEREKAAKEQGNFKGLYEDEHPKYEALVKEHDGARETIKALSKHVSTMIDAQTAAWPELAKLADPGEKDISARMAWVEKYRDKVGAAQPETPLAPLVPNPPAGPQAPPQNGTGSPSDREAAASQGSLYNRW